MMKNVILILALLLPLAASAGRPVKRVSQTELSSIVTEFRQYEGVEVVRMGRLGTMLVKGLLRHVDEDDAEVREFRKAIRGIKGVTVLEYDDAPEEVRERLNRRIARAIRHGELLMEAKDGDTSVQIFGFVDESTGTVRDFVLHTPDSHALICLFGNLSMDAVGKLMAR